MSTIKVDAITTRTGSGEISLGTTSSQTVNRTGDGELIGLQKAGSAIGSIGTANTDDLYIVNDDTGLMFSGGSDMIIPRGTAGAARDNAINLGAASHRFKDLYLSGGAYIGGTVAANHLDDYEEGTWSPTIKDIGGNNATMNAQNGKYVKVGSLVLANFNLSISSKGSMTGNYLFIGGLPFTHTGSNAGTGTVNRYTNLASTISRMGLELGGGSTGTAWWTRVNSTGSTSDGYLAPSGINANFFSSGTLIYTIA